MLPGYHDEHPPKLLATIIFPPFEHSALPFAILFSVLMSSGESSFSSSGSSFAYVTARWLEDTSTSTALFARWLELLTDEPPPEKVDDHRTLFEHLWAASFEGGGSFQTK